MTAYNVLFAAKQLIAVPSMWTRGSYARDSRNNRVPVESGGACKFCSVGAIFRVAYLQGAYDAFEASHLLDDAAYALYSKCAVSFNDNANTTHDEIMKIYDDAISLAKDRLERAK